MAWHLQACLICPRAAVWLKAEGTSDLFGVLPFQYPWPHFPFINHLVMVSVGWSIKVVPLLWPRMGCGPGYTKGEEGQFWKLQTDKTWTSGKSQAEKVYEHQQKGSRDSCCM